MELTIGKQYLVFEFEVEDKFQYPLLHFEQSSTLESYYKQF